MEDTLRDYGKEECYREFDCLNPCFNGRYSQRVSELSNNACSRVLILVLMEDTLRDNLQESFFEMEDCLNPCFNGRYSQSYERRP